MSFRGHPPDLIILDDLEPWEGANKPTRSLYDGFVQPRIIDRLVNTSVIATGTLSRHEGLMDRLLDPKLSSDWTQRFYKAVESYPEDFELWFQWSAIRDGDEKHEGSTGPVAAKEFLKARKDQLMNGSRVLWQEHEPFERLMELRAELGWAWFDRSRQGLPPGGCLRTGLNTVVSIGIDDEFESVRSIVDDAGYRRLLAPLPERAENFSVRLVIEGEVDATMPGKVLPCTSSGADLERAF